MKGCAADSISASIGVMWQHGYNIINVGNRPVGDRYRSYGQCSAIAQVSPGYRLTDVPHPASTFTWIYGFIRW